MVTDDVDEDVFDPEAHDIFIGSTFFSKQDLQDVVGQYHISNVGEYRAKYSDNIRYTVVCAYSDDCPFTIKARGDQGVWQIIGHTEHTCSMDPRQGEFRHAGYKDVGTYFSNRFLEVGTSMTPKEMQEEIRLRCQIFIPYDTALRAKHYAMKKIYGDEATSFNRLPSYLYMLQTTNPGTFTNLKIDHSTGKFENAFYALGASIEGFRQYGRPVIVVDGTHLKGKYKGILFFAVTQDGNIQVFPLAVGIGHVEEDLTWKFFMENLKSVYGSPPNLVIVSDGHQSISNAVTAVFPEAQHCLCYFHLKKNLLPFGQKVLGLFRNVAYSYNETDYFHALAHLKLLSDKAFLKLENLGPARWARSQSPVRRYEFMTSNAVESLNDRAVWARELPITSVLEAVREVIEHWFYERRTVANARVHPLTKAVKHELDMSYKDSSSYSVSSLDRSLYKVKNGSEIRIVDLNARTCDCGKYDQLLVPCSHAAAVIRNKQHEASAYVDVSYSTSYLRGMWDGVVMPVPDPREWKVPAVVRQLICLPPDSRRQAGRPRKTRFEAGQSSSQRSTQNTTFEDLNSSADPYPLTQRAPKKCNLCKSTGHTRKRCPTNAVSRQS